MIATPGHTPACVSYKVGDAVFVGDTLFMPDYGTARCDFPGGCAHQLYGSIQRILALPPETRLFMCHDYKAPGRDQFAWETTVAEQAAHNVHIRGGVSEDDYARCARRGMRSWTCPSCSAGDPGQHPRRPFPAGRCRRRHYLKIPLTMTQDG